jgi:hypothetical protein
MNVQDALREAAINKTFAVAFLKDPAAFKRQYSLTDRDVAAIQGAIPDKVRAALDIDYE